ncbi:hypothetical protein, partial [Saccharothrix sp. ST-888]|uniref:hypothetical protein n=1 Tax=Saccharothrix sp. ST-888 TaxID=1427391 RepID=UPI0005EC35BD
NPSPAAAKALAELRSAGIFGRGNLQFKNKFRPDNLPIYLCTPGEGEATDVAYGSSGIGSRALRAPDLTHTRLPDTTLPLADAGGRENAAAPAARPPRPAPDGSQVPL